MRLLDLKHMMEGILVMFEGTERNKLQLQSKLNELDTRLAKEDRSLIDLEKAIKDHEALIARMHQKMQTLEDDLLAIETQKTVLKVDNKVLELNRLTQNKSSTGQQ